MANATTFTQKALKLSAAALLLLAGSAAQAITIDSNISDWIKAPKGKASDWNKTLRSSISVVVEDQHKWYLNPGYGGQKYDAEAMYVELVGSMLNIGIATGRAPHAKGWAAGDIALNFDFGSDATSFEYGIVTRDHNGMSQGDVYSVDNWNYGLWVKPKKTSSGMNTYKLSHPTSVKSGNLLGNVDLAYGEMTHGSMNFGDSKPDKIGKYKKDRHYMIETSVDLALLNLGSLNDFDLRVHWTANCNNDWIQLDMQHAQVPEPASLVLLAIGLIGFAGRKRLRRKQA
ncbi:PEP-CTERM sorting domain-containing protein [endosymbiont of Ridgeia piscesae]|jgi:hypothetical protein|uniref:PEP-CTERM protein-sorting domain n=1 Tax=endosymbiont of Ridgeia piscesae TaxID=54398 RepID=A0A0T5YVB2_9GAMM|nr:PEP-CTERM sorting domain-containing protein [endosymbiont of Ridgeia piscesae]KRT54294.1 PEP-CTERM protein-sorting domain [endosymbiont of Ridgeia piscesae]KRT60314.1 PEP-CTERM protein-sorting domain-containing protein [endosymbiont of Ridgeia piscesae]